MGAKAPIFHKYIMKIKYLYETAADILKRVNASSGSKRWLFIANPQCCDLCKDMDGVVVEADEQPQWYGHVPNEPGRYNCKCDWKYIGDTNG